MRGESRQHQSAKQRMEEIINQHMQQAFAQIELEVGVAPAGIELYIDEDHSNGVLNPTMKYSGCSVTLE